MVKLHQAPHAPLGLWPVGQGADRRSSGAGAPWQALRALSLLEAQTPIWPPAKAGQGLAGVKLRALRA